MAVIELNESLENMYEVHAGFLMTEFATGNLNQAFVSTFTLRNMTLLTYPYVKFTVFNQTLSSLDVRTYSYRI